MEVLGLSQRLRENIEIINPRIKVILNEQEVGNEKARWQAVEVIETNLVANLVTRPMTLSRPRERLRKRNPERGWPLQRLVG